MKKWNLVIDVAKCSNCHNCSLAVKDEHIGNDFPGYAAPQPKHGHDWIKIERCVRGEGAMVDAAYLPTMCNHCDDAPCIKAAPDVVRKREDGIVLIDPQKARGRRDIVDACPYGAIWWNEELQLPQAWIFDAHLFDQGWKEPRCAQSCPTAAIQAVQVEDSEMRETAARQQLEVLRPELGTRPRVYYRNLYRFVTCFIGGSVTAHVDGVLECIEDARVALLRGGSELATARTDLFGDFKFDGLDPNSGRYVVRVDHARFRTARVEVALEGQSRYLDGIELRQV
jgi:Fe-S-cluster-containing dehydrogenase component